jgi:hypothetical protein
MGQKKDLCQEIEQKDSVKDLLWTIDAIDRDIDKLDDDLTALKSDREKIKQENRKGVEEDLIRKDGEISRKQQALGAKQEERDKHCNEERERLSTLSELMNRSASEIKYTVRVPFFGVALDVNDIGFLGGFSLWIVLIMLRLSLRSQIVSLRVGFKKAFASGQGPDFYDLLAARQVFVFPPLEDRKQKVSVARGWIEKWWMKSAVGGVYQRSRSWALRGFGRARRWFLAYLKIEEETQKHPARGPGANNVNTDVWRVNRNMSLRIVPKGLCLLPFFIYVALFYFDYQTRNYGNELSVLRTRSLMFFEGLFLINLFVFGVWCITKWNELDRLWDYYDGIKDTNGEQEAEGATATESTGGFQP